MKRKNGQRGATILEFSLAFMAFFSFIYGTMELGRAVASYNILSGAVREGARYAVVHGSSSGSVASSSDVQTIVRNWAIGLDTSAVTVTTTWSSGNAPGSPVKVQASYALTPFSGMILSNNLTLQSSAQMVISQ